MVKTCTSEMMHIALQITGRVWISCLGISNLLQNPIGCPLFSYFGYIVTGCLDTDYNYIRYNLGLPLVLTRAFPPGFFMISFIFLCNLI